MADDLAVGQIDLAVGLLLERQGVLHPVDVVTVGVVFTGVGTTRLLSVGGRGGGLSTAARQYIIKQKVSARCYLRAGQEVPQLQSLDKVGVPDHAAVLDANILEHAVNLGDLLDTLVQGLLCPEDADVRLHRLLHGQTDLSRALWSIRRPDLVEHLDRLGTSISADWLVLGTRGEVIADSVRDSTAKDDQIQEGVGSQAVGTVDGHASGFTTGEQTRDDLVVAALIDGEHLSGVPSWNTAHIVVDGRQDRNRLLRDVDTGENAGCLGDTGQTLVEDLWGQVAKLEVDVVLLRANTAAVTDLHRHGSGDDVARGKILGSWRVTLHETLTLAVQQVATLTTSTLGDQATSTVDSGRVELDELEILVWQTSTGDHGHAVTGTRVCGGAAEVCSSVATGGQNRVVREESVQSTILLVVGQDAAALAVLHDQVDDEVLDEVVGVVSQGLAVQGVQQGVAGSISGSTASVGLSTLAVFLGLATKGTLVAVTKVSHGLSPWWGPVRAYIFPSSVRENGQP